MFYADFEGSAKTKSLLTAKSRKLPEKIYGELDCGYFCPRLTSSPTAFVYSSNLIIFSEKEHKTRFWQTPEFRKMRTEAHKKITGGNTGGTQVKRKN
ncbi:MAG: hypothetical protein KDE33_19315 [Bacteroidetes bacterium]|nr:hypothetical protein [Bacteroidota bacterium]